MLRQHYKSNMCFRRLMLAVGCGSMCTWFGDNKNPIVRTLETEPKKFLDWSFNQQSSCDTAFFQEYFFWHRRKFQNVCTKGRSLTDLTLI